MQAPTLKTLLLALSLGAVAAAGAQTYGPATGDTSGNDSAAPASMPQPLLNSPPVAPAPADSADVPAIVPIPAETILILRVPDVPPTGIDSRADLKCRSVAVNTYWDCVNSSNAGQ